MERSKIIFAVLPFYFLEQNQSADSVTGHSFIAPSLCLLEELTKLIDIPNLLSGGSSARYIQKKKKKKQTDNHKKNYK